MGHHHRFVRPGPHDGLDVIFGYGNRLLPSFDGRRFGVHGRLGRNLVECRDGYTLSVIAGPGTFCRPCPVDRPRSPDEMPINYRGPYSAVEVSCEQPEPDHQWRRWRVGDYGGGLYSRVPTQLVRRLVDLHGGFRRMALGNVDPRPVRRAMRVLTTAR